MKHDGEKRSLRTQKSQRPHRRRNKRKLFPLSFLLCDLRDLRGLCACISSGTNPPRGWRSEPTKACAEMSERVQWRPVLSDAARIGGTNPPHRMGRGWLVQPYPVCKHGGTSQPWHRREEAICRNEPTEARL